MDQAAAGEDPTECRAVNRNGTGGAAINAGGIDGCFSTEAELWALLRF
jgi:hypothetical protein